MKKGKLAIAVFSAAMLLAILLLTIPASPAPMAAHPVSIQTSDGISVKLWEAEDRFYAFLPGHADPAELTLVAPDDLDVTINGQTLPLSCMELEPETDHLLSWMQDGTPQRKTLYILPASQFSTLYLNTQSGTMDHIHEKKGNAERGTVRIFASDGSLDYEGSLASIRGRGNSTWDVHDKKPYSLELTEAADLLGMGKAKKWILLADALDTSALRNKIVYDFAAEAGLPYTPEARWTEVYLNGEYAGLYLLSERVEIDPARLDLGPDSSLIYKDRDTRIEEKEDPYFFTESGQCIQVRQTNDIGTLTKKIQAMEDAILSPTGDDWQAHIDLPSWVQKYLVEECFGLYDAGFQSQYYYCYDTEETSKLYAGPIWDYDSSLGNPSVWALNSPQGLYAWRPAAMVGYETPWLHCLYEKPVFRQTLQQTFEESFLPLLNQLPEKILTEYPSQIEVPYSRNQIRWAVETEGVWAEAAYIADYLRQRTAFLSQLWLENKDFCILRLQEGQFRGFYAYYAVAPGSTFDALPEKSGEDFLGWYRADTNVPFDPEMPITEDLQLYPCYEGAVEEVHEDGLMDLILAGYHYVPAAVLALMGLMIIPVSFRLHRKPAKKEKQPMN